MGVVIRQSIKGTVITYIGAFIGFLTTMFVVTKFLQPEDIGLIKVILEAGVMFAVLAQLGTSSSVMRFFPYFKDEKKKHNGFFFYALLVPFIGCLLFIPLYIFLKGPVTLLFAEKSSLFISYYYWVTPLIFFCAYLSVFEVYSNVNMRIVVPRFNREIVIRLCILAVYLLYGYHFINRSGLVAGYVITYGVAMWCLFLYLLKTSVTSLRHDVSYITRPLRKDIFRYSLYLIIGALGSTVLGKLDLFMITSQLGLSYAGIFTIAFYMAAVIEIPSRSISAISAPIAAEALKKGDFETANALYKKVSLHQLLTGGLIFILLWANIDNIFAIIPNGAVYAGGKWVVFFIGLAKLIEVTLNFGGMLIGFSRYYYWSLYFVFFIIVVGILTNYLLIPVWGIAGAALATAVSCLLSCSVQQWIVLKKVKGNPYSSGTLKLIVIFLLLTGINYFLFKFDNPWIDGISRSIVLAATGAVLLYVLKVSGEVNNTARALVNKVKHLLWK
ncbi:MAG: polysaccharide biosynthesis C-terminal domain-containing protein [Prevotellaceae bacterium]|jgi:O-antigen/teichoic acid export membrane protein|nr:polysaccharide biosynthesis C-terminal domain-containing protein [Prevotellaceae bacterium]